MNARDLMTPRPVTVTPRATVGEVWDLMRELEIRHVPVVDGGALVGMLSDRDLGRLDVTRMLGGGGPDAVRQEFATPIVKLMNSYVIRAEPETGLAEIIELLIEHKVGALPVVSPDNGEVLGIVSYIDVLRALHDRLEDD